MPSHCLLPQIGPATDLHLQGETEHAANLGIRGQAHDIRHQPESATDMSTVQPLQGLPPHVIKDCKHSNIWICKAACGWQTPGQRNKHAPN